MNAISLSLYNEIFAEQVTYKGFNFVGIIRKAPIMVGGFIYNIDITVINDMDSIINPMLINLIFRKPFVEETGVTFDEDDGSVLVTDGVRKVIFRDGNEEVYEYHPQSADNTKELQARRPGRIKRCDPSNLKIPCMIGHSYFYNVYIDVGLPMNIMSLFHYTNILQMGINIQGRKYCW